MGVYKELFHYIPDKKPQAVLSVVLSVLASVLQILPFYFLWKIFQDIVVYQNDTQAWMWSIRIVGCMIAYTIVYFAALWVSHLIAFRLETNLRKAGIHHLMQASFSFFDKNPSGKIRKIIDDNAAETHMTVAHLIPDNASAIATPILMFIVMAMVDWPMAGLLLLVIGISAWQMKGMMGEQDFMRKYQAALERMNAETVEYVRGMPVLKVFRTTVQSFRALYASITSYAKLAYEYSLSWQIFSGMQIDLEAVRKNYPCALGSSQLYRQWITEMFALSKDGLHRGIEVYKLRFLELLLYIQNFNPQQEALCRYYQHCKKQKIEKIEAFLTQHLTERPTIEELSERFLISKTALKQAFKDLYGMPIYTYMIHYRMETGRQLLVETRRSITEIANALGYTNVSKFSACFAKIYGMQPSRYRNTHWMKTGVEGIVL